MVLSNYRKFLGLCVVYSAIWEQNKSQPKQLLNVRERLFPLIETVILNLGFLMLYFNRFWEL